MSIEARGISVALGGHDILHDVCVRLEDGGMLALLGPNGSGKSTLIRALVGGLRPGGGHVLLNGRSLAHIPKREIARVLAVVAQRSPTPPLLSVLEHVWLGRHPHRRWLSGPTRADHEAVERAVDACDLHAILDRPVEVLSGGERQRVRIATALAQSASHLILDEPLSGLDVEHQLDLLALLRRINAEHAISIMVVLHDLDHAARFFPRVALLREGRLIADGAPAQVLCCGAMEQVFRVDGCLSRDRERGVPVVVCSRLCERGACDANASHCSVVHGVTPASGQSPLVVVTPHAREHAGFSPPVPKESLDEPVHIHPRLPRPLSGFVPRCPALDDDGERARADW